MVTIPRTDEHQVSPPKRAITCCVCGDECFAAARVCTDFSPSLIALHAVLCCAGLCLSSSMGLCDERGRLIRGVYTISRLREQIALHVCAWIGSCWLHEFLPACYPRRLTASFLCGKARRATYIHTHTDSNARRGRVSVFRV